MASAQFSPNGEYFCAHKWFYKIFLGGVYLGLLYNGGLRMERILEFLLIFLLFFKLLN